MLPPDDRELLTQAMKGLNFDAASMQNLMGKFDLFAGSLEGDRVQAVSPTAFGGSYTGGQRLATNTTMAHEAVTNELQKMAVGLRAMGEAVQAISNDFENADDQSANTSVLFRNGTECVASPTFDGGQCSLPTNREG